MGKAAVGRKLLRIIAVAMAFVLALHWYLMLHLVSHATHHGQQMKIPTDSSKRSNRNFDKSQEGKKPYILSSVCGGCYRAYTTDKVPCFDIIQKAKNQQNQQNGTTLLDAFKVGGKTVPECKVCDPDTCYERYANNSKNNEVRNDGPKLFKYWRYDRIAPRYTLASNLVLPSIPDRLRIPPSRFDDIANYVNQLFGKDPDPKNTTNSFLLEYNPSLAIIPNGMRSYFPWTARYVAVLRVAPNIRCFARDRLEKVLSEDVKQTMHSTGHLGIALLDSEYQVLPGYDAVIDLDVQLDVKRWKYKGRPAFSDYRVFALNEELYLHANSDTVMVTKLKLRAKGYGADADEIMNVTDSSDQPIKLNNLHGGDNLEVTLVHPFNSIWGRQKMGEGKKWSNYDKNYALFSLPNGNIYAEIMIYPERVVTQIIPNEDERLPNNRWIKDRERRNFRVDKYVQRKVKTISETAVDGSLLPSFFTVDEHWFPGKRNPYKDFFTHGGACCVSMSLEDIGAQQPHTQWEGVDSLLVGVAHNVITWQSRKKQPDNERDFVKDPAYVSFFYAFAPRPPFELLARSGFFCLGFASVSDRGMPNPHSVLTHSRPFEQHNETFNCPEVHFVSTIVEKVDDSSSVVIGYGINNCISRLVEVTKREVGRLLFSKTLALEQ